MRRLVPAFVPSSIVCFRLVVGALVLLLSDAAAADITIVKSGSWEVYTRGQVNGFVTYGWGDANPIALTPDEVLRPLATLEVHNDSVPKLGPDGQTYVQGTFQSFRVRSGYIPNVFGLGFRQRFTEQVWLNVYIALWSTIESQLQNKTIPIKSDAREGYLRIDGPWGSFLAGRAEELFSRGSSENDSLYAHRYGLGFPGNIDSVGPAVGLITFGIMAQFPTPGLVYQTPNLWGLHLSAGLYDPAALEEVYDVVRFARPEAELAYDVATTSFRMHLFADGEYQKLYRSGSNDSVISSGICYGGRFELGPVHLGIEGYYGPALGLGFSLDPAATRTFALRTFAGYSVLLQYSGGTFDINVGVGVSQGFEQQEDVDNNVSMLKRQIGYSAALVYHFTNYLHYDLDVLRSDATWYLGEKQILTFVNTGLTADW